MSQHSASPDHSLPLTVLGGYLGVGKTTLINRLLSAPGAQRMAVLVNDFGELNIDAQLIAQTDATTIALTNGCVCCAVGDDLGAALATLHAQAQRFDQVLLEASGVADPVKLGSMAETWPGYRLQGVVVLADATRARALARDRYVGAHVRQQLADADLLLISKLDQVNAAQEDAFRRWLGAQSSAPTQSAQAFQLAALRRRPLAADAPARPHAGFATHTYRSQHAIDRAAFERWGRSLQGQAVRGKGFACFTDDPDTWLVQIVDGYLALAPTRSRPDGCELVLIAPAGYRLESPFAALQGALAGVNSFLTP